MSSASFEVINEIFGGYLQPHELEDARVLLMSIGTALNAPELDGAEFSDFRYVDIDGTLILDSQRQLLEDAVPAVHTAETVKAGLTFPSQERNTATKPLPVEVRSVTNAPINKATKREAGSRASAYSSLEQVAKNHGAKLTVEKEKHVTRTTMDVEGIKHSVISNTAAAGARILMRRLGLAGVLTDEDRNHGSSEYNQQVKDLLAKNAIKDHRELDARLASIISETGAPLGKEFLRNDVIMYRLESYVNRVGYGLNRERDKFIRGPNFSESAARQVCLAKALGHVEYHGTSAMSAELAERWTKKSLAFASEPNARVVAKYFEIGNNCDPETASGIDMRDFGLVRKSYMEGDGVVFRAPAYGPITTVIGDKKVVHPTYEALLKYSTGLDRPIYCAPCRWQRPHELHMLFSTVKLENYVAIGQEAAETKNSELVFLANVYGNAIVTGKYKTEELGCATRQVFSNMTADGSGTASIGIPETEAVPAIAPEDVVGAFDDFFGCFTPDPTAPAPIPNPDKALGSG